MTMRFFISLSLLTIVPVWLDAQSSDQFSQKTRPAVKEDLPGQWYMFFQRYSTDVDSSTPFYARHQVFSFQENGYVKNITATKRIDEEERKLFLRIMPENTKWEMPRDGFLVVRRSELDADGIEAYRVVEDFQDPLMQGSPPLKRGDLVLVYFDEQRQPYMRRYLRLIPIEDEEV